jgi:hypothetical protein
VQRWGRGRGRMEAGGPRRKDSQSGGAGHGYHVSLVLAHVPCHTTTGRARHAVARAEQRGRLPAPVAVRRSWKWDVGGASGHGGALHFCDSAAVHLHIFPFPNLRRRPSVEAPWARFGSRRDPMRNPSSLLASCVTRDLPWRLPASMQLANCSALLYFFFSCRSALFLKHGLLLVLLLQGLCDVEAGGSQLIGTVARKVQGMARSSRQYVS